MNIVIHQEDGHGISIDIGSPSYKTIDVITDEFKIVPVMEDVE